MITSTICSTIILLLDLGADPIKPVTCLKRPNVYKPYTSFYDSFLYHFLLEAYEKGYIDVINNMYVKNIPKV